MRIHSLLKFHFVAMPKSREGSPRKLVKCVHGIWMFNINGGDGFPDVNQMRLISCL